MTTRTYDYKLTLVDASHFTEGMFVIGNTSGTVGEVIRQDLGNNTVKVKVSNTFMKYSGTENVHANVAIVSNIDAIQYYSNTATSTVNSNTYIVNGSSNTFALPLTTRDGATTLDFANLNFNSLSVHFNQVPVHSAVINYPSTNAVNGLGKAGFDIKPVKFIPGNGMVVVDTNAAGKPIDEDGVVIDAANTKAKYIEKMAGELKASWSWKPLNETMGKLLGPLAQQKAAQFYSQFPDSHWDTVIRNNHNNIVTYGSWPFVSQVSNLSVRISTGNTEVVPYTAPSFISQDTVAITQLAKIETSGFIAAKNAFEQPPLVRLYDIYYPGEWYPLNDFSNPGQEGEGLAWPFGFPYRFAEVRGDTISDLSYKAWFDGDGYMCYPIDSGTIGLNQTGEINNINIKIANFDSLIAQLVENSFIAGNCANAVTGTVNNTLVHNLDPATLVNSATYNQSIVDSTYAGIANAAITYDRCSTLKGTWKPAKQDSRDLLGAVVRIKTTFANFLDYWPEYSSIRSVSGNVLELYSSAPYRISDNVTVKGVRGKYATVKNIVGNFVELNQKMDFGVGTNLMITNPDADDQAYIEDVFKVDKLNTLNGAYGEFQLTSWLQYFKLTFPRRKYYKNTCPWVYKGEECQYPSAGTGTIPGTTGPTALTANGFFTAKNEVTSSSPDDVCAKSFTACRLRNNQLHFGGFIGTGVTYPKG
tara:strand:+ start:172 stop:2271 length:2100 start_codon:yes stop_codon:yes gene_type:complete